MYCPDVTTLGVKHQFTYLPPPRPPPSPKKKRENRCFCFNLTRGFELKNKRYGVKHVDWSIVRAETGFCKATVTDMDLYVQYYHFSKQFFLFSFQPAVRITFSPRTTFHNHFVQSGSFGLNEHQNQVTRKHTAHQLDPAKFVRDLGEITRDDCGGLFPCFFPNVMY